MARKRKGSKPSPGPIRQWVEGHRDDVQRVVVRVVVATAIVGALVGGGLILAGHTRDYVDGLDRFETQLADLEHDPPPYWIRARFLSEVQSLGGLPDRFSVLDAPVLRRLAGALRLHPWVERVEWVRARHPNRVQAKVHYRWPLAMVQVRGGGTLVDRQGVVLRAEPDFPLAERAKCFWISGILTPPPRTSGRVWDAPAIKAACELACLLRPHKRRLRLNVIDMINHNGRQDPGTSEIVLWTNQRTRIDWGRAADTDKPGELSPEVKASRLLEYARKYGSLDGRYDLDVRHWDSIGLLPRRYTSAHSLYQPN